MTVANERAARIFNGTYTIESTETGQHRTFDIKTQRADANFAPGKRVVALLRGPDNVSDYQGFGFVDDNGIHVWRKKQEIGLFVKYADMLWSLATEGEDSPWYTKGYRLHVEGRCLVCNRKLTTPASITSGIGPICRERL